MKAAALGLAIATIALSPASAERIVKPHGDTAPALMCLLDHVGDSCKTSFTGDARRPAQSWLYWSPNKDFQLGNLVSAEYAWTETPNSFTTKYLFGRTADVYYVKYRHQEYTFYIVPPNADGQVTYMLVRGGKPEDEKSERVGLSRIR